MSAQAAQHTEAAEPRPTYPRDLERTVFVRDGARVRLRPIRPEDEPRLVALFERLSPQTIYQRFFTAYRRLPAAWYHDFANVDYQRRLALVAERDTAGGVEIVGVTRWEGAAEPGTVETAIVVDDEWQGRGLGALLFDALMRAAEARGIDAFCADVLAENQRMLRLLRTRTAIVGASVSHGVVTLRFVRRTAELAEHGGPRRAPHAPRRSERPGEAVALLDFHDASRV